MACALLAGCRLPGREGPVPQSLADCRRFSRQGVTALERGRPAEAEALLSKAVAACEVDAEARRHYAESLWRRKATSEAIAQMQEACRLSGEDAELTARLAEMQLIAGQMDLARKNAERALDLDAKLPKAWIVRGRVTWTAGRPRDALADYLRALSHAPHDRELMREVALLYRQLNEPQRSLQTLQSLAETYSPGEEPGQVLFLMGESYMALGRHDDAAEQLAAAVARGQPTAEMYCRLAEADLLAGHPTEAAAAARQALALDPRHQSSLDVLERIEVANQPAGTVRR